MYRTARLRRVPPGNSLCAAVPLVGQTSEGTAPAGERPVGQRALFAFLCDRGPPVGCPALTLRGTTPFTDTATESPGGCGRSAVLLDWSVGWVILASDRANRGFPRREPSDRAPYGVRVQGPKSGRDPRTEQSLGAQRPVLRCGGECSRFGEIRHLVTAVTGRGWVLALAMWSASTVAQSRVGKAEVVRRRFRSHRMRSW